MFRSGLILLIVSLAERTFGAPANVGYQIFSGSGGLDVPSYPASYPTSYPLYSQSPCYSQQNPYASLQPQLNPYASLQPQLNPYASLQSQLNPFLAHLQPQLSPYAQGQSLASPCYSPYGYGYGNQQSVVGQPVLGQPVNYVRQQQANGLSDYYPGQGLNDNNFNDRSHKLLRYPPLERLRNHRRNYQRQKHLKQLKNLRAEQAANAQSNNLPPQNANQHANNNLYT